MKQQIEFPLEDGDTILVEVEVPVGLPRFGGHLEAWEGGESMHSLELER